MEGTVVARGRADDERAQASVLSFLIDAYPAQTSLEEVRREMAEPTYGPFSLDEVNRAIRDLVHAGLLHQHDTFVFPTRSAVRAARLPD